MKRNFVFASAIMLFAMAVSASAQKAGDFSGTWVLDVSKSKPAETMIESQTLVVTQTAADIKVERASKRKAGANPGGGAPGGGGGGRGGGGMMGGGDGPTTYLLDGKVVKSETQGQMGSMQISTSAKIDDKGLKITRSVETPMGARETIEKWWLNADGTLTVESSRPNRDGGTDTTTRVYTKKA